MPEGTKAGDKVSLMTEYEVKPDGKLCIASIEDVAMPGYDGTEEKGEKESYPQESQFYDKYKSAMSGTPPDTE